MVVRYLRAFPLAWEGGEIDFFDGCSSVLPPLHLAAAAEYSIILAALFGTRELLGIRNWVGVGAI